MGRHQVLERLGARFMGFGSVRAELADFGEYPGARPWWSDLARVSGEVYELPKPGKALEILDRIEGVRRDQPEESLFRRDVVEVLMQGGGRVEAWIYWINRPPKPGKPIPSGDYRKWKNG
jgi:gamma-glutamylcyclotransferase (GGCT)/AIG2-like uncharacterized protein YtfP